MMDQKEQFFMIERCKVKRFCVFIIIICFMNFNILFSASYHLDGNVEPKVKNDEIYAMGFEAETSVIKVLSDYPYKLFKSLAYP